MLNIYSRYSSIRGLCDRRGFSVPEMLAVVAIIIIVLALLLPALRQAREPAYAAICESNLHQLMLASHSYAVDNRSYLPFPNWGGYGNDCCGWDDGGWLYSNPNNETWNQNSHWTNDLIRTGVIFEYHNDIGIYRCPQQGPPYPILSGQITSYNMNGSVIGYGNPPNGAPFRRYQFKPSDFIYWEVDPFSLSAGWWWDGGNFPHEGIATIWHARGGTLVALDGSCSWMTYADFVAEYSQSTKNRLWNAPDTNNGH